MIYCWSYIILIHSSYFTVSVSHYRLFWWWTCLYLIQKTIDGWSHFLSITRNHPSRMDLLTDYKYCISFTQLALRRYCHNQMRRGWFEIQIISMDLSSPPLFSRTKEAPVELALYIRQLSFNLVNSPKKENAQILFNKSISKEAYDGKF